jgi:hypothetical protein
MLRLLLILPSIGYQGLSPGALFTGKTRLRLLVGMMTASSLLTKTV